MTDYEYCLVQRLALALPRAMAMGLLVTEVAEAGKSLAAARRWAAIDAQRTSR